MGCLPKQRCCCCLLRRARRQRHGQALAPSRADLAEARDGCIARAARGRIAAHRCRTQHHRSVGAAVRRSAVHSSSARKWRRGVTSRRRPRPESPNSCDGLSHGQLATRTRGKKGGAAPGRRRHDSSTAHATPAPSEAVCKLCQARLCVSPLVETTVTRAVRLASDFGPAGSHLHFCAKRVESTACRARAARRSQQLPRQSSAAQNPAQTAHDRNGRRKRATILSSGSGVLNVRASQRCDAVIEDRKTNSLPQAPHARASGSSALPVRGQRAILDASPIAVRRLEALLQAPLAPG
jgi:hypothetical protein